VEECEADRDRYRSWLAKIGDRDYFAAPGGMASAAVAAVNGLGAAPVKGVFDLGS
jgi:hypothetical protein